MTINLKPTEVWAYFVYNKNSLEDEMYLLAEDEKTGIEIYLTNDEGFPFIVVCRNYDEIDFQDAWTKSECDKVVQEIYDNYLSSKTLTETDKNIDIYCDDEYPTICEEIEEREAELTCAMEDFLAVALQNGLENDDEADCLVKVCVDRVLETLSKFNIDIFRPMLIEYEDGSQKYEEYPYKVCDLISE